MEIFKSESSELINFVKSNNLNFSKSISQLKFNNSNVICYSCGQCDKEVEILKCHYDDINLMICADKSDDTILKAQKKYSDDKLLILKKNIDDIDKNYFDLLDIDTLIILGFSYKPYNLLNVLLYNDNYYNFIKEGGRLIIEPSLEGFMLSNSSHPNLWMNVNRKIEMDYYEEILRGIFEISIFNDRLIEISSCLLTEEDINLLKSNKEYSINKHFNISSI